MKMKSSSRSCCSNITKAVCMFLFMIWVMSSTFAGVQAAEMKLHVIHLTENNGTTGEHGDAVLLESRKKYLLMDTGLESTSGSIIRYLKKNRIRKISIYISHMHQDHIGGIAALLKEKGIKVERIYLPARKYAKEAKIVKEHYQSTIKCAKKHHVPIKYIQVGSKLKIGGAKLTVLGPVGTYSRKEFYRAKYINNYCLCTMVTGGGVKFLTAGDIYYDEEENLLKKYGNRLQADIMKINHHGLDTSNSQEWINTVKPKFAFASNQAMSSAVRSRFPGTTRIFVTGESRASFIFTMKKGVITVRTA